MYVSVCVHVSVCVCVGVAHKKDVCGHCACVERVVWCEECDKCGTMVTECIDHTLHRHVLVSVQTLREHKMMILRQMTAWEREYSLFLEIKIGQSYILSIYAIQNIIPIPSNVKKI